MGNQFVWPRLLHEVHYMVSKTTMDDLFHLNVGNNRGRVGFPVSVFFVVISKIFSLML